MQIRCAADSGGVGGASTVAPHLRSSFNSEYPSLVAEVDMPYKNSQVAEYGDSFASWVEDDFSKFISSLITALPVSALTIVVLVSSNYSFLCLNTGPSFGVSGVTRKEMAHVVKF